MPFNMSPQDLQESVELGWKRNHRTRRARLTFLKQYVGQYYDAEVGRTGQEPLNLIYNAIRVLVPNLVFNYPEYEVETDYLQYREYGKLHAIALKNGGKKLRLKKVYRQCVVDAIFLMGIMKTGICTSDSVVHFDEDDSIDPGMVYTERVDFSNFVWDPNARDIDDGLYQGDRSIVSRTSLLESGLYNNELIERLPAAYSLTGRDKKERVEALSAGGIDLAEAAKLEDMVEIVELWIPRAKAIVTVPADATYRPGDYLRVVDYYGPDSGPYSRLVLTPPVPNNPLPISAVGIWSDLHRMTNKLAKKQMEQADRQKTVVVYNPASADDVVELQGASDGESIAVSDPDGINTIEFGGKSQANDGMLGSLQLWFNQMAGNPDTMAGVSMDADSATAAQALINNASVNLTDMQDAVYAFIGEEATKRFWYGHTDPLMETPVVHRRRADQRVQVGPDGTPAITGGEYEDVQVMLTPEMRRGDFLDYAFTVKPLSLGRQDPAEKYQKALEFAVKILPAAAQAAQVAMMMGAAFSFQRFVTKMAEFAGIDWLDEVFEDPALQQAMAMRAMLGPQMEGSKGQVGGGLNGIMQNGGSPSAAKVAGQGEQQRASAQQGANQSQASLNIREI